MRQSIRLLMLSLAVLAVAGTSAGAEVQKPKFGPHAIPIQQSREYLRTQAAPDYWAMSPFYIAQMSSSACSLATIATMLNTLRGLPAYSTEKLVTQASLLEVVGSAEWARKTAPNGEGVTFTEFRQFVELSLKTHGLDADIEIFRPSDASPATLAQLRSILADNERSADDIVLLYYNQGVVTGDWDGPHLSPLGAYDAERRRVLIMDVDREFYGPYWSGDEKLLEAMLRPAPAGQSVLAGEIGGLVRVILRRKPQLN